MAAKFKMASETYVSIILLQKLQFSTDFKNLEVFSVAISILFGIQFVRRWFFVHFGEEK
jgi:hypothetical protein